MDENVYPTGPACCLVAECEGLLPAIIDILLLIIIMKLIAPIINTQMEVSVLIPDSIHPSILWNLGLTGKITRQHKIRSIKCITGQTLIRSWKNCFINQQEIGISVLISHLALCLQCEMWDVIQKCVSRPIDVKLHYCTSWHLINQQCQQHGNQDFLLIRPTLMTLSWPWMTLSITKKW